MLKDCESDGIDQLIHGVKVCTTVENFKPENLAEPVRDGDRDCLASLLDDDRYSVDAAQS